MVKSYQAKLREPEHEKYPKANDIMSRSFFTVTEDCDVFQAIDKLLSNQISGVCVVDKDGKLTGFLSEKDCLQLIAHEAYHHDRTGGVVSVFMSKEVLTIDVDEGLLTIAKTFVEKPFRKLPVVSKGRLVGVVRRRDALQAIQSLEKRKNKSFRSQFD